MSRVLGKARNRNGWVQGRELKYAIYMLILREKISLFAIEAKSILVGG